MTTQTHPKHRTSFSKTGPGARRKVTAIMKRAGVAALKDSAGLTPEELVTEIYHAMADAIAPVPIRNYKLL
jgi:hypothetical protein